MKLISQISFCCLFVMSSYGQSLFQYNLDQPGRTLELPEILKEVSGITHLDSSHIACVQDELGIVFVYDFINGIIVSQHEFEPTGDFEGIAYTGDAIFILRSDGRLSEWSDFRSGDAKLTHHELDLDTKDNEGLCHDEENNQLLIAGKSKPRDRFSKNERIIYAFDLAERRLMDMPFLKLHVDHLAAKALEFDLPGYSTNRNGEIKGFNFRPSDLSIHPITDEVHVISSADELLVVLTREGEVKSMHPLDPDRHRQPEGITFFLDGTMIITNEADDKVPMLFTYMMKE